MLGARTVPKDAKDAKEEEVMGDTLSGREILELAIQAEEKGLRLYKTLSRKSKNFHVSQVFKELAAEEEKHIEEFKELEDKFAPYEPMEAYPGEYILYIKAMADENTFKCNKACETFLETDVSEEDAIQAGITFEKDFILFLHNFKRHVNKNEAGIVDSIITSEENHLKKLYAQKKKLVAS
ncbi:MAG: ferritin family protein [Candidatus Omnitrophica bacterium]|nr:ferritin family protein [Candidatus Omnitrophota bacterium]